MNAEHILQKANKLNHFSIIKMLISEGLLNYDTIKLIFITAINYGNLELLKFFIDSGKVDLEVDDNLAIRYSSLSGYTDIVKLLLESDKVSPGANDNFAIRYSSKHGHTEIVKLLLESDKVDPRVNNNEAIREAVLNGHTEIVELLKNWSKKWNSNYRQKNL